MTVDPAVRKQRESHYRTALKTMSWRIIATLTTMIITWIITGSLDSAWKVGGIEFFAKMFLYYAHERAWQIVPRGAIRKLFGRNGNSGNSSEST